MYIFLIGAISFAVLLSVIGVSEARLKIDDPQANRDAVIEVDQYRAFLFVADQYMKSSPPAVTSPTAVRWDILKKTPFTAPGAASIAMPASWKIVRNADNTWVACTEMRERSAGAIWQLAPPAVGAGGAAIAGMTNIASVSTNANNYVVVGDPTTAAASAASCDIN